MMRLFVVVAISISTIHAYQTHFSVDSSSSRRKLPTKHHDHRFGKPLWKDPFSVTTTTTFGSPLRTRLPTVPPFPLFQTLHQDQSSSSSSSSTRITTTSSIKVIPASIHPFEKHEPTLRTSLISKFISFFRIQPAVAWIKSLYQRRQQLFLAFQRKVLLPLVFGIILLCSSLPAAWAAPGGRMGGSFSKSSSSPSSSYSRPSISRPQQYRNSAPRITIIRPLQPQTQFYYTNRVTPLVEVSRGFSVTDVAVLTGVGLVMANGFRNNYRRDRDDDDDEGSSTTALGPGVTVASLTVALNIPNRQDPNNILNKLHRLSQTANTDTRRGVQDLISTVAMELLRQERSVISVRSNSKHVKQTAEAQRIFNQISTRERSKFDRESVNQFGGVDRSDLPTTTTSNQNGGDTTRGGAPPTLAIVTLTLSIEGDQTILPTVKTRTQLREALSRIAADAMVEDCLLAGEVLWAPEGTAETLTQEEVMADYPDLLTIL